MIKTVYRFPWVGFSVGIALIFFFVAINDALPYFRIGIPAEFKTNAIQLALLATFCLITAFEFSRYLTRRKALRAEIKALDEKLDDLLKTKIQLQNRTQRYADNANRLKLFISDRLLEYLEYDEKYLHFKNIASEVRHNGVISYDKVKIAMSAAIAADTNGEHKKEYRDALNAMAYLWDLLDLSTTENISLYIANRLYECEEIYYRQVLSGDSTFPVSPLFSFREAVYRAAAQFVREGERDITALPPNDQVFTYQDDRYRIRLENADQLLGNENYIYLILENLVTNALYYANNRRFGNAYSRIGIELTSKKKSGLLTVYNAGPHIDTQMKEQIYQLGFSTKRTKGHHGRGLGLYFVKQIVNGYEGKIGFTNVKNALDTYVIRIELESGDKFNEFVEVKLSKEKKLICYLRKNKTPLDDVQLKYERPIKAAEVSVQSSGAQFSVDKQNLDRAILLDPEHPMFPYWCLEVQNLKTVSKLIFKPLDASGVIFYVELPTAKSRLDPNYYDSSSIPDTSDGMEQLNENFKDIDPYIN